MFSLNENNQILLFDSPVDMRLGVNRMCGHVNEQGLTPTDGRVYAFMGRTRQTMKLLHWERGGYVMYYKRLETGRFSRKAFTDTGRFRVVRWDELVLLMEGISTQAHRRKRFQVAAESTETEGKKVKNTTAKIWLSR
jgi:transposase